MLDNNAYVQVVQAKGAYIN